MKKNICFILLGIILFLTPCTHALAKGIDVPIDTSNTLETVFFTFDEFLELYSYNGKRTFYLKEEFLPYKNKIFKERFYDRIVRIEGETYEAEIYGKSYELPLYTFGKLYIPYLELEGDPSLTKAEWQTQISMILYEAIPNETNFKWDRIKSKYYPDGARHFYIFWFLSEDGKFDESKDIGIAIETKTLLNYDNCQDYTYPTQEEYYEMFSGKSSSNVSVTPTPLPSPTEIPTATPTPLPSPTEMPTATPTPLPSPTEMPTATPTPLPSPTEMPTATPTPLPSPTEMPTATPTPLPSPTEIPTATLVPQTTELPVPLDTSNHAIIINTPIKIILISCAFIVITVVVCLVYRHNKKK